MTDEDTEAAKNNLAGSGLTPSDAAMSDFAFNALAPLVEADRERRAGMEPGPGSPTAPSGDTARPGTDGRSADEAEQANREARNEFENIGQSMEPSEREVPEDMRWDQAENEADSLTPDAAATTVDDPRGAGESEGDSFDGRSPTELDRGFSLPAGDGPSPAELDPGFTPPEHIEFEPADVDVALDPGSGAPAEDAGFFEG